MAVYIIYSEDVWKHLLEGIVGGSCAYIKGSFEGFWVIWQQGITPNLILYDMDGEKSLELAWHWLEQYRCHEAEYGASVIMIGVTPPEDIKEELERFQPWPYWQKGTGNGKLRTLAREHYHRRED